MPHVLLSVVRSSDAYVRSVFQMPSQTLEAPVVAFAPFAPPW